MAGGYGRGWRHRRVFRSTGVPGLGRAGYRRPGRGARAGDSAEVEGTEPVLDRKEELRMLEEEEQMLESELEDVKNTITELKKKDEKEVR